AGADRLRGLPGGGRREDPLHDPHPVYRRRRHGDAQIHRSETQRHGGRGAIQPAREAVKSASTLIHEETRRVTKLSAILRVSSCALVDESLRFDFGIIKSRKRTPRRLASLSFPGQTFLIPLFIFRYRLARHLDITLLTDPPGQSAWSSRGRQQARTNRPTLVVTPCTLS